MRAKARTATAVACLAALSVSTAAQARDSLFPREGCTPTSRINPCQTRALPAPVGDPTDGPLTEDLRDGPLDMKPDPLGYDAPRMEIAPLRLKAPKDPLGMGNAH